MGIDRMSASQVSRICESLDDIAAVLQTRDLSEAAFPYVWLDGTYIKCPDGAASPHARAVSSGMPRDASARRRRSCWRTVRSMHCLTSTSPMPITGTCAPATFGSTPTASSSTAPAWRRSSRPGSRLSACSARSSPRWTRPARRGDDSPRSQLPGPRVRQGRRRRHPPMTRQQRSMQGTSSMSW